MKKYLFIIPLIFLFSTFYFTDTYASIGYPDGTYIVVGSDEGYYRGFNFPSTDVAYALVGTSLYFADSVIYEYDYHDTTIGEIPSPEKISNGDLLSVHSTNIEVYYDPLITKVVLYYGSIHDINNNPINYYNYDDNPVPPPPEPGESWVDDMWDWFLYVLGFGDDFADDIDEFITGGDRVHLTLVTPTPSPTPTPRPSPTPYVLDIVDPNTGQPVYTITGIPGNYSYNYYEGDTNDGSDFDIFEVDLQVGDGGSSNPRDGLNDVMKTNNDYLEDIDISPVSGSFSVLPSDWYLLIGVLISFPVIAGFISKLLK